MPEISVDEDRDALIAEYEVRATGKIFRMRLGAQPDLGQKGEHEALRPGILTLDP